MTELESTLARLADALAANAPIPAVMSAEDAARYLRVGMTTFREKIACREDFPRPVPLTDAAHGHRWLRAEVDQWMQRRRGAGVRMRSAARVG